MAYRIVLAGRHLYGVLPASFSVFIIKSMLFYFSVVVVLCVLSFPARICNFVIQLEHVHGTSIETEELSVRF